ncbi:MAG: glutaredoxin domain-containing protein [Peptoniphilus sp.]|nr:glutaredoxin domain-containing protein [Peptoniphilus sp.]MDY3119034.1 glutaredoxin domain-containing protein [Peptoniphilus sp.]
MKVYGTDLCPDCVEAKKKLKEEHISYDYVDITASIQNLKAFMRLRDSNEVFDEARESGFIGIPTFVKDDGAIVFSVDAL